MTWQMGRLPWQVERRARHVKRMACPARRLPRLASPRARPVKHRICRLKRLTCPVHLLAVDQRVGRVMQLVSFIS
jgi:cytochrome oxidase assembly protein ShyY1